MARRPAPVQATFAGYPGSTGVSGIDYRVTDPHLEPATNDDAFWSERPIRLPHSFWCYEGAVNDPPVNEMPALTRGHVTFGCLNNFMKVNERTLRLWARVLRAVEGSRLTLIAPHGTARTGVLKILERDGVAADRVTFSPHLPRPQYMAAYHDIDLALDTFPYNGHTTSLDALWMGVPTVTISGVMPAGRAGVSQLHNLDLAQLIARDDDDFVRIAAEQADNASRLNDLRLTLRDRMRRSPLADAVAFARAVENAYRTMWRQYSAR
jgi:predicted O-linked N-acetylglucosamine transferase (SPINDLY family)